MHKGIGEFNLREHKKSVIGSLMGSEIEGTSNTNSQFNSKLTTNSQEPTEHEKMKNFNCDPKWPVCLYDFTFKNKVVSQYALKVRPILSSFVIQDHFYPPTEESSEESKAAILEQRKEKIGDSEFDMVLREH